MELRRAGQTFSSARRPARDCGLPLFGAGEVLGGALRSFRRESTLERSQHRRQQGAARRRPRDASGPFLLQPMQGMNSLPALDIELVAQRRLLASSASKSLDADFREAMVSLSSRPAP